MEKENHENIHNSDTREDKQQTLEELKQLEEQGILDEQGILEEELASEQEEEIKVDTETIASLSDKTVYQVKIVHSSATVFCICEEGLTVQKGDYIIVPTRYGRDLGIILGEVKNLLMIGTEQVIILQRKATDKDLKLYEENKEKDLKAFNTCKQKISEHKLSMKLVSAHYLLDEPKILFFFTAEARVDFRELVKDLVSIFKTRIELRQIGVRDESRVLGGVGLCGRGFCCNSVTDKLKPVSIKMAKEQNLSLNSLKISGACGRLLCCLAYEYPFYKEMKGSLPSLGEKITFETQLYSVIEVNIFTKKISLKESTGKITEVSFHNFVRNTQGSKWSIKELT
ncbi:MAG: hypothetical protein JXJ04_04900 [Spirochaetales bacterium]|nr:hypothetical protein [Spirochaetales bacterium]